MNDGRVAFMTDQQKNREITRLRKRVEDMLNENSRFEQDARTARASLETYKSTVEGFGGAREKRLKEVIAERDELLHNEERLRIICEDNNCPGSANQIDWIAERLREISEVKTLYGQALNLHRDFLVN